MSLLEWDYFSLFAILLVHVMHMRKIVLLVAVMAASPNLSDLKFSITDLRCCHILVSLFADLIKRGKENHNQAVYLQFLTFLQEGTPDTIRPACVNFIWLGDKHVQCGRKADVLKFWFMWKAKGTSGLENHVDKIFENARYFYGAIENRPGFEIVIPDPECTNICFWYVPESLRTTTSQEFRDKLASDSEFREKLHSVAPKIKERMMTEGTMMVTYQTHKSKPNFFRMVFQNSGLDKNDMLHLIQEFERLGQGL